MILRGQWPGLSYIEPVTLLAVSDYHDGIAPPKVDGDVGYDLRVAMAHTLPPCEITDVRTGVRVKSPPGTWTRIVGRSSAVSRGILVIDNVIDNGYTGELMARCLNLTAAPIDLRHGERIAQLICMQAITPVLTLVDKLPATVRGDAGFGSTGR